MGNSPQRRKKAQYASPISVCLAVSTSQGWQNGLVVEVGRSSGERKRLRSDENDTDEESMNVDANTNLLSVPMDTLQHSILGDLPLDAKKNTEQCSSFFKLLSCRLFS